MKRFLASAALAVVALTAAVDVEVCKGQTIPGGRYFGQDPPGSTPVVFAPGIISQPGRYEYCLVFSPSLDECVFGLTNSGWSGFNLLYTKMGNDSTWTDPVPAPFQGTGDALYPSYSADGNEIYFASSRPGYPPTRIWRSSREGTGWTEPVALDPPVYSGSDEWGSSLTDDGVLYFCSHRPGGLGSGDIYRAVTAPDGEVTVENLGASINSPQLEGAPRIARDESYLIFESRRPGGYGQSDLYISFNDGGAWTTPRNLGPEVNTAQIEDGPFVSPDGQYLFFNRRASGYTTQQTDLWWVDAHAILDPAESGVDSSGPGDQSLLRVEPNPFGPSTRITYSTPSSGFVTLKLYDVMGREVRSLVNASRPAGTYSVECAVTPGAGSAGGIYYCSLQVGDRRLSRAKIVSLR